MRSAVTGKPRQHRPSLARDSGRAVVGAVVSNACNVLVILVIARLLGSGVVGEYTIAFAARAILLLVCGLGMRTAMTRFVARHLARDEHDIVRGSVRAGLVVPVLVATVVATLWFFTAGLLARHVFDQPVLELPMQLFAVSLPFYVFTDTALAATQGFQTMRAYVWVGQVLEPVLRLALTVAVLVGGGGLDAAALALLISSVVSSVAAAAALHRMLAHLPGSEVATPARELASFSMLSWVASMATQGLLWADILILGVLVSAEDVGAYQVAARVVLIGMFVITPLTASMAPRIAHAWAHDDRSLVTRRYVGTVLWSSRLSFPALAGLLAVPTAILHLFGDDFGAARGVVVILAVGAVAEAVGAPSSVVLNQIGRNRLNMGLNLSALVLNIGLNLLLIPPFGIEGSAFAWAVTLVAGAAVRIVVLRRVATERWPWSPQLGAAAVGGVLAGLAAALVASPLPSGSALRILVAALAVVVVYGVVVLGFGLDRAERDLVSRTASLKLPALRRWRVQWRLRQAEASAERLRIDELISPFRLDVLARAELFRLARAHEGMRRDRFSDFVALARNSRYGEWFDQVLVARGYAPGTPRAQERTFRSIVVASLQLMDRHDRLGRESLGKVTVTRVPAGTALGDWTLGEDRWVLLDGGHRVALALLAGETELGPDDYVIEPGVRPPNNTASFLDAGRTTRAEALAFLARGLVGAGAGAGAGDRAAAATWDGLLDHLVQPQNREPMQRWPHAAWLAGRAPAGTQAGPVGPVSPSAGR